MKGQSHVFAGVDVSLPSKVQNSEAEDEWQEVDWASWSTGELSVDSDAFVLVFKPSAGGISAKPLGALVRASPVDHSGDGRTLMVTTSDAISRLYRLTFASQTDADAFAGLARQAEQIAGPGEDSLVDEARMREEEARLEAEIREALEAPSAKRGPVSPPALIYGGAELCGPDPGSPSSGQVLLGNGAAVLLDPPDDGTVGVWKLLFYSLDDGGRKATSSFDIGPSTRLRRQAPSGDPDDAAATFTLTLGPRGTAAEKAHTVSFMDAKVAALFARDFRVRQRVMELSLMHAKGQHTAQDLLGEVRSLKRKTFCARMAQVVRLIIFLVLLAAFVRMAMLYNEDKGARKKILYVKALVADVRVAARASKELISKAGSTACQAAFQTVPAVDLQRCLGMRDSLHSCVAKLVP